MPAKSIAQYRLMTAVANNKKFAKKVGIPQSVGKEFTADVKENEMNDLEKKLSKISNLRKITQHNITEEVKPLSLGEYEMDNNVLMENFGPNAVYNQNKYFTAIATDDNYYRLSKLDNGRAVCELIENYITVSEAAANKTSASVAANHDNVNKISHESKPPKSEIKKPKSLITLSTTKSIVKKV